MILKSSCTSVPFIVPKSVARVIIIALVFLSLASLQAQEKVRIPMLGSHKYVQNNLVPDPFIKTYIRNSLGIGQAVDLQIPPIIIEGDTISGLAGDLLFATLAFEYQHAVKSWMAVRAQFQVTGRLGTGPEALLFQGVTAVTGFELGWLFKVVQKQNTMLSASVNVWNTNFTAVSLFDFVERVIEDGGIARDNKLVTNTPALRGGGGLRLAHAFNDVVGVNLLAETGFGEATDPRRKEAELFYKLGGAVSVDLGARTAVPIGFSLGFGYDTFPEGGSDRFESTSGSVLRIAYTGTTDFSLGLETGVQRFPLRDDDRTLNLGSTTINLRYYFQ